VWDPVTASYYGNCNYVTGSITLTWGSRSITVLFGDSSGFFRPSVCTQLADPAIHDLRLTISNRTPPDFPSRNLGDVDWASGWIVGVSTPAKNWYEDTFSLQLEYGVYTTP